MSDACHAAAGLSLRPATAQDRACIRRWFGQRGAGSTWSDAAAAEAKISLAMGSEAALCRMIERAGTAIGYGHAVAVGLWAGPPPGLLPAGTWEVELLLAAAENRGERGPTLAPALASPGAAALLSADALPHPAYGKAPGEHPRAAPDQQTPGYPAPPPPHVGRGLAAAALALLTDEVFATTLAIACCGLVPISEEAAVRDHERARFHWRRIWHDPVLGPTWVMLRERPA